MVKKHAHGWELHHSFSRVKNTEVFSDDPAEIGNVDGKICIHVMVMVALPTKPQFSVICTSKNKKIGILPYRYVNGSWLMQQK